MSKKYVIEIKPEYEDSFKGVMLLGAKDNDIYVDSLSVENLEELNSDYINKNFGELQGAAYDDGRMVGIKDGMCDAWEAARKLFSSMADSDIEKAFPNEWNNGGFKALMNLQPQEAIAKLKAYEEKQKEDDSIKVGDEVIWNDDTTIVVTMVYTENNFEFCEGVSQEGHAYHVLLENVRKTGKHYDIQSILEAMRT